MLRTLSPLEQTAAKLHCNQGWQRSRHGCGSRTKRRTAASPCSSPLHEVCAAKATSAALTGWSARVFCGNTLHFLALLWLTKPNNVTVPYGFPPSFERLQRKISFGLLVLVRLNSCPKASGNGQKMWRGTGGFFHENIYVYIVPEPTALRSSLKCRVNLRHSLWCPYCLCEHLKAL